MDVKVGQKITYIYFSVDVKGKIEKEYKEYKILGISKYLIVLDNIYFTHLKCGLYFEGYPELDKSVCSRKKLIASLPEEITCYCYSTSLSKKVNTNKIKKAMREFIEKDSWYIRDVENIVDKIEF